MRREIEEFLKQFIIGLLAHSCTSPQDMLRVGYFEDASA